MPDVPGEKSTKDHAFAFPAIVLCGSLVPLHGKIRACAAVLVTVSYAVYILHYPAIEMFWAVFKRLGFDPATHPAVGLAVLMVAITAFAWTCDAFYDVPIRRYVTKRLSNVRLPNHEQDVQVALENGEISRSSIEQ